MILEETYRNIEKTRYSPSLVASISETYNMGKRRYEVVMTKSNRTRTIKRLKFAASRKEAITLAKTWVNQ